MSDYLGKGLSSSKELSRRFTSAVVKDMSRGWGGLLHRSNSFNGSSGTSSTNSDNQTLGEVASEEERKFVDMLNEEEGSQFEECFDLGVDKEGTSRTC